MTTNRNQPMDTRITVPVRTDLQVSPFEGSQGIKVKSRPMRSDGKKTFELIKPASWTTRAACLNDWKAFAGDSEPSRVVAPVLCGGCPVIDQCLSSAMTEEGEVGANQRGGIRGGKTPTERFEMANEGRKCPKGLHDFAEHVRVRPSGARYCVVCERLGKRTRASVKGEGNPWAKLTKEKVLAIRAAFAAGGVLQSELATEYGIDPSHVSSIIRRTKWAHV